MYACSLFPLLSLILSVSEYNGIYVIKPAIFFWNPLRFAFSNLHIFKITFKKRTSTWSGEHHSSTIINAVCVISQLKLRWKWIIFPHFHKYLKCLGDHTQIEASHGHSLSVFKSWIYKASSLRTIVINDQWRNALRWSEESCTVLPQDIHHHNRIVVLLATSNLWFVSYELEEFQKASHRQRCCSPLLSIALYTFFAKITARGFRKLVSVSHQGLKYSSCSRSNTPDAPLEGGAIMNFIASEISSLFRSQDGEEPTYCLESIAGTKRNPFGWNPFQVRRPTKRARYGKNVPTGAQNVVHRDVSQWWLAVGQSGGRGRTGEKVHHSRYEFDCSSSSSVLHAYCMLNVLEAREKICRYLLFSLLAIQRVSFSFDASP